MEFIVILIGLSIIIWGAISWTIKTISNSNKYIELKPQFDSLKEARKTHESKVEKDKAELSSRIIKWEKKVENDKKEIIKISKQKSMGFPWLAEAYADYFALKDDEIEKYLKNKKHPAYTAAENVKIIKNEKRVLVKENKIISYKINYFEKLFPWLSELIAEDEDEEMPVRIEGDSNNDENEDRVKHYLTPEEYKSLPSVERNQMALDRYLKNRNKSKWAIGRDYEMYVGYLYTQKGYSIEYKGIIDGFEDLGRDIIAKKPNEVCIIQCKCWAQHKKIHEKHIFQLFGTTMEYWIRNFIENKKPKSFEEFSKFLNEKKLRPIFYTSTRLSEKAKEMANALCVEILESKPLGEFPRIKCNINSDGFGQSKIYHLPMDQQYDRTIIGNRSGEFYAYTVKEAENAGFRRAFRHRF
ncbi:restriction endonuclease [Desulfobacula sp.]|uniref:restriction endonuclease n=1 Tax=Desulfobacula sp. TaxID=2593537 RepID=UPI0019C80B12|nr:restriction endonuclease [Candidatus Brocadiales bacterium]MBL6995450.1 restriction endonuclease [Desulfobacula sp.]